MPTIHSISTLIERLARILQNDAHTGGLKPTQWEVLRYLSRANQFSRMPSAVTTYLGMTKGTVSQTISALERKGLIAKEVSRRDKRIAQLSVTRAGRKLLLDDPVQRIADAMTALNPGEQEQLTQLLKKALRESLRSRGGKTFGACHSCRHFDRGSRNGRPHRCMLLDVALSESDSQKICVEHESHR